MLNLKSPFYLLASTAIVLFAGQVYRAYASPATGAIAGLADPGHLPLSSNQSLIPYPVRNQSSTEPPNDFFRYLP